MDQQKRSAGGQRTAGSAQQRANLRRLRAQQVVQQENQQTWQQRGLPMWARMLIAVAVVLLLLLVFFRVDEFEVNGNVRYSSEEVADASGVTLGDVLMGVNKTQAASRILVKLPYVQQVVVSKALPGTVRFTVQECKAMAAAQSEAGVVWLINDQEKLLERLEDGTELNLPIIRGVTLDLPLAGDTAVFSDSLREARALEAAKAIWNASLQGDIRSIDVTDPEEITLSYRDRVEVHVGDGTDIDYKLQYMLTALGRLGENAAGMLDLSFSSGNQAVFHPVE